VDCDEHKDLAKEYGVSGFPSLKLFKEGKPTDYSGGRTTDDIVKYVIKKSGPPAKVCAASARARAAACRGSVVVGTGCVLPPIVPCCRCREATLFDAK